MREVHDGIYVGRQADCFLERRGWAAIHACKHPCHLNAAGYSGSLPKGHPNYLFLVRDNHLFLNLIDPPIPLFMPESFLRALEFISAQSAAGQKILVHCNQGESRAPSIALLYLAKQIGAIPNDSFESAKVEYLKLDPLYRPGKGISKFFSAHWSELGRSP